MLQHFDLIVIGAGPGGYVAAIRAAQKGKKVAIIEKSSLGGTCLNVGCIPSKTFLQHSEWIENIKKANFHGISAEVQEIHYEKLVERKNKVVSTLAHGIEHLLQKNNITLIKGEATILKSMIVMVNNQEFKSKDVILATGSRPFVPPIKGLHNVAYYTTDTFFNMKEQPKELIIIGGGVIGIELAFAMAPLGTKVTVIEAADDILLTEDDEARTIIKKKMNQLEITYYTKAQIVEVTRNEVLLDQLKVPYTHLLVATGRKANIDIANALHLELDENQRFIKVNRNYLTSKNHVYAIGDVIGGYQLAHAASKEGLVAVAAILNESHSALNQEEIPRAVYTHPEIASFGLNEEQAKDKGYNVLTKKMTFKTNGRAIAMDETVGFVKLVTEKSNHEILGAVVVGANATELLNQILAVKHSEGRIEELCSLIYGHPNLSETIGETAESMLFKAIHE
ncbi:dihydrolipoyl dehydrogenase [Metabacillus litoralis]|uniref:dihydrolipoyl dehydrogenase n=1 Tax=Metabacillus litoralis TaxID=152268 RepID=UPI00203E5E1B|nr:dihydrolipoyl dehydrogenase [Metabacillus litoralis]MCM3163305.1 dihydrolipoyl dehydrogenase [Metabacillus litoralis]